MGDVPEQVFIDAARAQQAAWRPDEDPEWQERIAVLMAADPPFRAATASAYHAGQAATPDGPRTWADGLRRIADRARAEAAAGAPAGMVAWYVSVEAQHVGAEHDGDAQSCEECNRAASEDRARWTADATPAADGDRALGEAKE